MSQLHIYNTGKFMTQAALWQGIFSVCPALRQHAPVVISFVGAGGKTTWIMNLAREGRKMGKRVLIVTTTHMKRPTRWGVLTGRASDIARQLENEGIAIAGIPSGQGKMIYIGDELFRQVYQLADFILIEADGSKRMPLKTFGVHEPVIVPQSQGIVCLMGISCLYQSAEEGCFRWQNVPVDMQTTLTPDICSAIWKGCMDSLFQRYGQTVIPVINQCDTSMQKEQARYILRRSNISQGIISTFTVKEREP